MSEIDYNEALKNCKITQSEILALLIANVNDRPNASSAYGKAKLSSTETKRLFDKQFELSAERHNDLTNIAMQFFSEIVEAVDSVSYKLTDEDRAVIAENAVIELTKQFDMAINGILAIQSELMGCSVGLEYDEQLGMYGVVGRGACTDSVIKIPSVHEDKIVRIIHDGAFSGDASLNMLILPEATGVFLSQSSVAGSSLRVLENAGAMAQFTLSECENLQLIKFHNIPEVIYECQLVATKGVVFDFTRNTNVPPLKFDMPGDHPWQVDSKILVPISLYGEWITATNWTLFADHIEGV